MESNQRVLPEFILNPTQPVNEPVLDADLVDIRQAFTLRRILDLTRVVSAAREFYSDQTGEAFHTVTGTNASMSKARVLFKQAGDLILDDTEPSSHAIYNEGKETDIFYVEDVEDLEKIYEKQNALAITKLLFQGTAILQANLVETGSRSHNGELRFYPHYNDEDFQTDRDNLVLITDALELITSMLLDSYIDRDREERVAFCMANHSRLGHTSHLSQLPPDLIRRIMDLYKEPQFDEDE